MSGPYNMHSPTSISEACEIGDLDAWLEREVASLVNQEDRILIAPIIPNILRMVRFSEESILLWPGCDRIPPPGERQRVHRYPDDLKRQLKAKSVTMDTRCNGPAIAAFLYAGGERPTRSGSTNGWSIHHLYSGKFPYIGRRHTMHAVKDGNHFTQSAGLVAVHPILDAICDEFASITWYLRARTFERFNYDPDQVFS